MRLFCVLALSAGASLSWGQSIISAHSGTVHYIEGTVTIEGSVIHPKFAQFIDVKDTQTLATENGRAEILLTPGVFLRLWEHSSVRMISNKLSATRIAIPSGVALVEVAALLPGNALTVETDGAQIALPKSGLYRIDADAGTLRVFDGRADVTTASGKVIAKKGHEINLKSEPLANQKFNTKQTDSFYDWSVRRAYYIAAANETSARIVGNSAYASSYSQNSQSSWLWNPFYGVYTFMPGNGMYSSPLGPIYFSPSYVNYYYPAQGAGGVSSRGVGSTGSAGQPASSGSISSARGAASSPAVPVMMGGRIGGGGGGGRR